MSNDAIFNSKTRINEQRERLNEAKKANPSEIELVCLINRMGIPYFNVILAMFQELTFFEKILDHIYKKLDSNHIIKSQNELAIQKIAIISKMKK